MPEASTGKATITRINREFKVGDLTLPDPGTHMTEQEVLDFYSAQYPSLNTATIEKEEHKGDKVIYKVRESMGTKG